ncbi:hypothetical protein EEB11_16195 [Pseudotabrizicola sediminis]|uniref:Uncharacterized protein n=1 Tax=Pseudotabrizicola sediminis TaxID=2486418 RepID=A0ABY2KHV1_9RHOB|nr:hypothetical protein EEB11_16195 [Pseudotabrizicola sediminis]
MNCYACLRRQRAPLVTLICAIIAAFEPRERPSRCGMAPRDQIDEDKVRAELELPRVREPELKLCKG